MTTTPTRERMAEGRKHEVAGAGFATSFARQGVMLVDVDVSGAMTWATARLVAEAILAAADDARITEQLAEQLGEHPEEE